MRRYRLLALSLALVLLPACASPLPPSIAGAGTGAGRAPHGSSGAAATATAWDVPIGMGTPSPAARGAGTGGGSRATATPRPPTKQGTMQAVWETFYAAIDNDPAGSLTIAYPAPEGKHAHAGGRGTYADPITLAADQRWLPVGTRVYAPRWHKYFIMEDQCVECEADWGSNHFHHVDLFMPPSLRSGVLACESAATKDQAENDIIILNPDPNRPVDPTPLYTDAGGCVEAAHQY